MQIASTEEVRKDFSAISAGLTFSATIYEGNFQAAVASTDGGGAQLTIPIEHLPHFLEFCQGVLTANAPSPAP